MTKDIPTKPGRARAILKEYGYRPKKARGQNFLVKEGVLDLIAAAARIQPDETVIEIGPGPGNLTRRLVKAAKHVIAIELEHELASILKAELPADNLTIVEADALTVDFAQFAPTSGKIKVVANLPYQITTPMLFKLLATPTLFSQILLLIQKEVAQRIVAPAGKKPYGILSVRTQLLADCEIALEVGPESFLPKPKVDSALLRFAMLDSPRAQVKDLETFKRVVRAAFAKRRKTLRNSFSTSDGSFGKDEIARALEAAGVDSGRRAETVTVEEFAAIANYLAP